MKKIFNCALFVSVLSIISIFVSCGEVGLGASIDVEAPKISITYPPASSVVRDSFVLAGTCSDDKSVSKIIVNIFSTGNGSTEAVENYVVPEPTIKDGKKWQVTLNEAVEGAYPLKDGKYSIEAYAVDGSDRESGKYTLAVEIDNTAPVFVIQTPGSDITDTHYGSIFKVRGSVAEDHKLKYMTVSVFDTNNKLLSTWTENDVDISGTTSVTFARYSANESRRDELHDAYCSIYDTSKSGEQSFKISVKLGDNAGIWRTPVFEESSVEADDAKDENSGNSTSELWLDDSINGDDAGNNNLLGKNAAKQYEIGTLLRILNGTSDMEATEAGIVKDILDNSKLDTSSKNLKISLNKDANPTYEIGGYSFSESDIGAENFKNEAFKNGTITLKADYGLDETQFLISTIKVYLAGPYAEDEFTEELLREIYDDPAVFIQNNSSIVEENGESRAVLNETLRLISDNSDNEKSSVSSCSLPIKLPDDIISQKYYIVFVTGNDKDGLEFLPSNGFYGFKGGSSGSAPHVEIRNPDNETVSNANSVLKVSGLVTSDEDDPINALSYEVIVSDILNKNKYLGSITGDCQSVKGEFGKDSSIEWTFDATKGSWQPQDASQNVNPFTPNAGCVYGYAITVTGTTEKPGSSKITVQIDNQNPEVKIVSVSPYAELSEDQKDYFVNGIITITGNISDSNLESAQLVISDSGDMIKTINLSDQTYFSENINTGIFSSGLPKGRLTISLSARDKAGNSSIIEEKSYIVDQTTDLPKITLSDSDLTLDTKEKLESAINEGKTGNLFDQSSNNKIRITFSDDDKVDTYSVQYTKDITSDADKIPENSWILLASGSISSLSKTLEVELKEKEGKKSLEDGLYRMRISAKDIKSDGKSEPVTKTTEPFFFAIDTKAPVIEITKVLSEGSEIQSQDGTYYVKEGCTIFGKVSEKYMNALYSSFDGKSERLEFTSDSQHSDVFDFQLSFDKDELKDGATNKISFSAQDKALQLGNENLSIYLDTTAPKTSISVQPLVSLTETQGSKVVTIDYYVNGEIVVKANASDRDKVLSSRVALYDAEGIFIKDIYTIGETLAEGLQSPDSFDTYIDTTDSSIYTDNTEYTVKIFSKDRAGNETSENDAASYKIFVKQETDKPVVTVSNADAASIIGAREIAAGKNLFNDTTNNKLSFSVSDDDGIMSFEVKCYKVHLNEGDSGFTVDSEEFVNSNYVTPSYQAGARAFSYTYILPKEEGLYKIVAYACDTNYKSSNTDEENRYFVNKATEDGFWYVAIDAGAPKLILNRQSGSFMAKDEAFNLDLTAEDSSGYVKVYRYAGKTVGDVYYSAKELSNRREKGNPVLDDEGNDVAENSFEVSQTGTNATKATDVYTSSQVGHESRVIYYVAEDKYNQTTTVSFNYKIDELSPTLYSEWTGQSEADQKWTKITNYTYSIPLSDAWDNVAGKSLIEDGIQKYSGISNVEINIYKEGVAEPKTSSMNKGNKVDKDHDDTKGAFYEYYTVDSTYVNGDGVYTATVTAKDDSGQSATFANIFTNRIDTTAPQLGQEDGDIFLSDKNNTSGQDFTKIDAVKYNLLSESNPLVLKAKAHDLSSGISRIEIKDKFGSSENTIYDTSAHSDYVNVSSTHTGLAASPRASETDETYTFEISKNLVETGNHTYTIIFYDAAGNFSSESINMISDITPPSIQVNAPSPFVNVKENEQNVKKYNGKITVSGTVTDETELGTSSSEVTWKVFTAANTSSTLKASGSAELHGTKSSPFSFEIDTTEITAESGTYFLLVTAKDKAGNTQAAGAYTYTELKLDQTTDIPVIHLSNATASLTDKNQISTDANKNLFGSGNPALIGTVTDDDGIESVEFYIDGTEEANRVKKAVSDGNGGTSMVSYIQISEQTTSVSFQLDFSKLTSEANGINFAAGDHTLYIKVKDTSSGLASAKYTVNDGTVTNANGTVRAMAFAYDTKTPTINVEKVEFEGSKKAFASGMWLPKEFDIWFTVSDDTFDEKASVTFGDNDGANDENRYKLLYVTQESVTAAGTTYTQDSSEKFSWSLFDNNGTVATGDDVYKWKFHVKNTETTYDREFQIKDKYGRYSSITVNYKVDATKPEFDTDYIRVKGSFTNASGISSASEISFAEAVSTTTPKWFTAEAITISGYGLEGDGNENNRALKETNPEKLTLTLAGSPFSMTTDSTKQNKFGATVSFAQGVQTATLVAEDGAGNKSEPLEITLRVDSVSPVVSAVGVKKTGSADSALGGVFKKTDSLTFTVSATEETSGIKGIYVGTKAGFAVPSTLTSYNSDYIGSYTTEIDASDSAITQSFTVIPSELNDGVYNLYVRVVDVAGNVSEDYSAGQITIDTTKPVVQITSPSSGKQINKNTVISGIVTDANLDTTAAPSLYIYSNSSWIKASTKYSGSVVDSTYDSESGKWTVELDTTKINNTSTGTTNLYYDVRFTDKAGNETSSPAGTPAASTHYNLTVNQNSDRPVISLSGIARSGTSLKSNGNIYGTVSDDDGDLKGLWFIKSTAFNAASPVYPTTAADNGWTKLPVSNSSWQGEERTEGDSITWFFYAIDKNDGVFSSVYTDKLKGLYIKGNEDTEASDDYKATGITQGITFNVDMNPPEITEVKIAHSALAAGAASGWTTATDTFGTSDCSLYVQVTVKEGLGMMKADNGTDYKVPSVYIGNREITGVTLRGVTHTPGATAEETDSYTYLFDVIDLSAVTPALTGSNTVKIIVSDASGFTGQGTIGINYDTQAPKVTIVTPTTKMEDAVTGAISIKGLSQDDYSSLLHLYYQIPLYGVEYTTESTGWNEIAASTSWEIRFASGANDSTDSLIYYANAQTGGHPTYQIEATGTDGIFKVPVYFKVVDSVGNTDIVKDQYVLVDKEGGKPNAWINTPEINSTTSGKVTVYGGASDNVSVGQVQLQIDADGDGAFTVTDYNLINSSVWADTEAKANLHVYGAGAATADNWYIACTGTNSWKTTIDTNKIGASSDGNTYLRMRVRAFDEESTPQTRNWTTDSYVVKIDANVPVISGLKLVQYGLGNSSGTVLTEREYISGMYISNISALTNGDWYLTGTVTDDDCVSSITYSNLNSTTTNVIPIGASDVTGNTTDTVSLNVKLDTTHSGMIYCTITAKDNSTGETSQEIKINIDSTSPSMYTKSGSETTNAANLTGALRLKSQSAKLGNGDDENDASVQNSNSYFTFGDVVSEGGSGLKFIAFDFEREGSSGHRAYDPMVSSTDGTTNGKIEIGSTVGTDVTRNADGLLSLQLTATRNGEDSLESSDLSSYITKGLVRRGGLVKIAGTYATILSASGNKVTFSPTISKDYTTVEIIFACVVDHQLTESVGSDGSVVNDDGDGMIESIVQIGSSYQWTASVNSTNIPDGPVTINVVSMDNAGNLIKGSIATVVSNNRPRIAKVLLGTDLNGNGKYDYRGTGSLITNQSAAGHLDITSDFTETMTGAARGEFSYYPALSATNAAQSSVQIDSGAFKVVSGLVVVPEFVGGNNGIGYLVTRDADASLEKQTGTVSSLTGKTAFASLVENKNESYPLSNEVSEFGAVVIANGNSLVSGSGKYFYNFTFWDKTEETAQGTTSQWATLSVPVTLSTDESNAPVPKISPFYWKGAGDSSVLIKESGDAEASIKGHIELEGALPTSSTLTSGLPKVSGKIKIEGTVYDDVRLSSISMSIFGGTNTVVGNYSSGSWNESASLPTGVVSFSAEDEDISQNGHTVKYTAVVDTETLSTVVGTNKAITISATDWKSNSSTAGSTQTSNAAGADVSAGWTDCYKMDVVPYVTEIWTKLSATKPNVPSVYSRSSTGEYVVQNGEAVSVFGWNLNKSPTIKLGSTSISASSYGTASSIIATYTDTSAAPVEAGLGGATSGFKFTVPDAASGTLSVSIGSIPVMNNVNENDKHGSAEENTSTYAGYYNRKPNGQNNNILTDDLKLDVWNFKTPITPVGAAANYVHMKVGPYDGSASSGRIGFSFRNGAGVFNMPGYMYGGDAGAGLLLRIPKSAVSSSQTIHTWSPSLSSTDWPGPVISSEWDDDGTYYYKDVPGFFSIKYKMKGIDSVDKEEIDSSGIWTYNSSSKKFSRSGDYPTVDTGAGLYSHTKIGQNYQGFTYNDFAWDANGETYGAALCSDTSGNDNMSANFQFFSRGYGENSDSLNFNYYNCTNGRRIENTKNSAGTYDERRVMSPAMATFVADSKTYVYMAYWDHLENRIIYRVGSVGGTGAASANDIGLGLRDLCAQTTHHENYNKSTDVGKLGSTGFANRNSTDTTYVGDSRSGEESAYHYVNVLETFSGVTDAHVTVGALSDGSAVVVWYDDASCKLKAAKISKSDMLSGTLNTKTQSVVTLTENGGAYVSMAVDSSDGIHLAYMSNTGANLYYARVSSSLSSVNEVLVDVGDDVGDYCSIDVARESSTKPWIPTISYKSNVATKTKIAYPVFSSGASSSSIPEAGADAAGFYTGFWAICTLPSSNKSISDTVSVGYNKGWSDGVWHNFATVSEVSTVTTAMYTICNSSIVSGNGTSNPVVGYAVASGSIEMAQKK